MYCAHASYYSKPVIPNLFFNAEPYNIFLISYGEPHSPTLIKQLFIYTNYYFN